MQKSLHEMGQSMWHVQRVKRLVREHVTDGAPCLVSVRETICQDPECAGPATEIVIVTLSFDRIAASIHKSVADVVASDVAGIL